MMTTTSIAFAPLLPWPVIAGLASLAGIALLVAIVRRPPGLIWRFLAIAAVLMTLMNPSAIREERNPVNDVAVIVADHSPSQQMAGRAKRTDEALAGLQRKLAEIPGLDVRTVYAGQRGRADDETRVFEALDNALADVPRRRVAGTFLLTDGQIHDVPENTDRFKDFGPVHTLLTGSHDERDRRLAIETAPAYGIVGKNVTITIKVEDTGNIGAQFAMVTAYQDGQLYRKMTLPVGQKYALTFDVPHGGQNLFEFQVETVDHEITLANNKAAVIVNGVRDRLKVLLVSGEPHAGERTWRNLLKSDPGVDLVHFTILRPPSKQDATPITELSLIAFPVRELFELKLNDFDLIIFDRYKRRGVLPPNYYQNIAQYVRDGGAILEASGPDFAGVRSTFRTALMRVLPGEPTGEVIEKAYRPEVTKIGQRHPVTAGLVGSNTADSAPTWGRWFRQIGISAKHGMVLMEGADHQPLLVLDRVGEGRIAQLASDQIWLWSRGYDGGGPQAELLRRLAHWLMKEPELEENDLRAEVDGSRVTVMRRSLEDEPAAVSMTTPSGKAEVVEMTTDENTWSTGTFNAAEIGVYKFDDGTHSAFAVVGDINAPELTAVNATGEKVQPVADASGGAVKWVVDEPDVTIRQVRNATRYFGANWLGVRRNGDYTVSGVSEIPLLPAGLVLLLCLGTLAFAWRREGR